ncbi:oxygen-insensitive NAD(P)H nitroreductase [Providencia sp. PROV188]|uniref:oxygen-insensitive NAD(P)H nitroreductase n=1 Tax=Providencia sp. PROV188 TaxID=2939731 RepID=UPI0022DE88D8|nr:oxygen-insensitive NAD(P)H nitroreductase [Providencia sp. PROV188]WBM61673.1 oxygen-insensitive NAD(P)H nitroreductase [Providencia sp. PROV188]
MNLINVLNTRYATKSFDPNKTISDETLSEIKALLQLSPSSVNVQPWHFLMVSSPEAKQKIINATAGGYSFNEEKIRNASHVVVMCAKTELPEDYLLHLLELEDEEGRYQKSEFKEQNHMARSFFVNLHKNELKDLSHWIEKQVYLNMGALLLGAAVLGVDALPMEGLDFSILNDEFDLNEKGLSAVTVVALGYKTEDDFNSALPKVRLPLNEVVTEL